MRELLRRHTSLLSWLLLAACLGLFISAGRWQYAKAVAKQERIEAFQVAGQQPASSWAAIAAGVDGNDSGFDRIHASGQVLPQRYLLDNQIRDGRPGIEVFAPMRAGNDHYLLLALGWLAYPDARRQLPELPPLSADAGSNGPGNPDPGEATAALRFTGLLAPPPAHGLRLGRDWPEQPGPDKLMPYFDIDQIRADSGLPLAGRVLWLDPGPEGSPWRRDWQPAQGMPPERHLAYAWQWWSMAVASIIVFIVLHYRRRNRT